MMSGMGESKKVLVISSSESLPRLKPEYCGLEETWPYLLRKHFNVYQVSIGGLTIDMIITQVNTYHMVFQPDVVVIQAGINDCVPRALKKYELSILSRFRLGRWFLERIVKKYSYQIRKWRNITYTRPEVYSNYMKQISEMFPHAFIMPISILQPLPEHEKKVFGLTKRVEEYNDILRRLYPKGFVSIRNIPEEGVMSDFIHFNAIGHSYIYERVMAVLEENMSLLNNPQRADVR